MKRTLNYDVAFSYTHATCYVENTCTAIYNIKVHLFADWLQLIAFRDRDIFIQQISVFNYVCLKGCHPREMRKCWHADRLVKCLTFCLTGRKFDQFFRVFLLFAFTN